MTGRYFNWRLAVVLVMAAAILGATAWGLRQWQRSRRAERGRELGYKAYNEQQWEQAAANLGRYLSVVQDDVPVLLAYGDAQMNIRPLRQTNVQQAISAYHSILRLDAANEQAAERLGQLYLDIGVPGEAELIANRALQTVKSAKLRTILAAALVGQRKFTQAVGELKGIIKDNPEEVSAYEFMGQLAQERPVDFPEPAASWFDKAVNANPARAMAYIARGAFHLRRGDAAAALEDFTRAEKLDLSDPNTRLVLAGQFVSMQQLERASSQFEIVEASEPSNQILWRQWAELALRSDSNEIMSRVAQTGLARLSSQPWDFMPLAAELYIRCEQLDRAGECISRMRQKEVAPATAAFLEGLLAERQGKGYEAIKAWRRAQELGGRSARIRLALAAALSQMGDSQAALNQLRTLVSEQPNLLAARLSLARLLGETGQWAVAVEQSGIAKQIAPRSSEAQLLDIRARLRLLSGSRPDRNAAAYREMESILTAMSDATGGALEVQLLQFELAMQRDGPAAGQKIIEQMKAKHAGESNVAMAEASLLVSQGRFDEAIEVMKGVVARPDAPVAAARYLVGLLWNQGRLAECEKLLSGVINAASEPSSRKGLSLLLAEAYGRLNEQGNRCSLLAALAEQLREDVLVRRELLTCETIVADLNQAQRIVDEIKDIEGEQGWQWRYEQARAWYAQSDFESKYPQVVSLLQANLLANPDDQASRILLAESHRRAGNDRLAVSVYEEALSRSPNDAQIIARVVAALYRANEYERADAILRGAAEGGIEHPALKRFELESYLRRGELSSASSVLQQLLDDDPNNENVVLSLALLKMRQDNFSDARKLLDRIAEREPNSLGATVAMVELSVRQGSGTEAINLCDRIVDARRDAFAYILRARVRAMLGSIEDAKIDFRRAVDVEPNNVEAWVARSDFCRSNATLDEAIADIDRALALAPDNVRVQQRAIWLYLTSGNPERLKVGRDVLANALRQHPDDVTLRLQKARLLLAEQTAPSIEQATLILESVAENHPQIGEVWAMLAQSALSQGQPVKAIGVTLRGLVHRPNDKTLLMLKARAEATSSASSAIPTLKALQELDPNDVNVAAYLAEVYVAAGQPDKAMDFLGGQLSQATSAADKRRLEIALAMAMHKAGNQAQADEILGRLRQSAPDDPSVFLAQTRVLRDHRQWEQLSGIVADWYLKHPDSVAVVTAAADELAAMRDSEAQKAAEGIYRIVSTHDANAVLCMMKLAMLLQNTGRSAEAVEIYRQVLRSQPGSAVAANNLAWILCEEQGQYKEALELADKSLAEAPNYVDLIDTRGVAYYRLGQFSRAADDFRRCVHLYPDGTPASASSYFHLARALAQLGQKSEAVEHLTKALQLNSETEGLAAADFGEAQRLLEELSKGGK